MTKAGDEILTLPPMHPGEVLREEFFAYLTLPAGEVAKHCGLDAVLFEAILAEKENISAETAKSLSRYFGTTPEFWTNLQAQYDHSV